MNSRAESRFAGRWTETRAAGMQPTRGDVGRAVLGAVSAMLAVAATATAYGFLEAGGNRPALKLGGAFFVAGLAAIVVLFGRSMLRPERPDAQNAQQHGFSAMTWRDIVLMALAFLSVAAATLHFAVIEQHFAEYWLYGAFFIAVGLFELVWALLAVSAPSRPLYWASAVINILTIVAYVITRTVGLLVGPAAHETEMIGFGDLAATTFEAMLVVGSLLLLFRSWGQSRVRTGTSEAVIGTLALGVTAVTVLGLFSTVGGAPFVTPAG